MDDFQHTDGVLVKVKVANLRLPRREIEKHMYLYQIIWHTTCYLLDLQQHLCSQEYPKPLKTAVCGKI